MQLWMLKIVKKYAIPVKKQEKSIENKRFLTLVNSFVKPFLQFVCYSSDVHDELNAISCYDLDVYKS